MVVKKHGHVSPSKILKVKGRSHLPFPLPTGDSTPVPVFEAITHRFVGSAGWHLRFNPWT